MFFLIIFSFLIIQRLIELLIARRNERIMKSRGAKEYASGHYTFIVIMHCAFFLSLGIEVYLLHFSISPFVFVWVPIFIVLQALRIWTLRTLGIYWNTKIIILDGAEVVKKGPFRFLRHPNYVVVALEFIIIPLMFNAYFTAVVFTLCNWFLIRYIRIPAEEAALQSQSNYSAVFERTPRFVPQNQKRS